MTRMQVAQEILDLFSGGTLVDGCIWIHKDDEHIPVSISPRSEKLIGWATDLQRDKAGVVTMDISIFKEEQQRFDKQKKYRAPTVYLADVQKHEYKGITFVTSGRLREVFFTEDVPWSATNPGASL